MIGVTALVLVVFVLVVCYFVMRIKRQQE